MADDELASAADELREIAKTGLRVDSFAQRLRVLDKLRLLGSMPAVQAAGPDATARFEYLAQAITDAIDDLSRSGTATPSSANHREADALRHLFGLTEQTRRAVWRVRQDAAANVLFVSWEHFRHQHQAMLLRALAEQLVANATAGLHDAAGLPQRIAVYPPQADIESQITGYIRRHRPGCALLLEVSTATSLSLLRTLRDVRCDTRLLIGDPAAQTLTPFMQERMRRALADLETEFGDDPSVDIRSYAVPASLRGRLIGEFVAVGWYTYRDNKRLDPAEGGITEVWGHDNALVVGRVTEPDGRLLAGWFEREYQRLWEHRLTTKWPS